MQELQLCGLKETTLKGKTSCMDKEVCVCKTSMCTRPDAPSCFMVLRLNPLEMQFLLHVAVSHSVTAQATRASLSALKGP